MSTKFNLPKYLCKAKETELRQSNVCAIWAMSLWQVKVYGSGQLSSNIFQFVWCWMYSILWFCCLYKVWQRTNSTPWFTYHGLYKSCQVKCNVKGRCDWVQMFTFNCSNISRQATLIVDDNLEDFGPDISKSKHLKGQLWPRVSESRFCLFLPCPPSPGQLWPRVSKSRFCLFLPCPPIPWSVVTPR